MSLNKALPLAALSLLAPLAPEAAETLRARYLMGTVCEIRTLGPGAPEAATAAFEEIARLESAMTLYREESELSALNRGAGRGPFAASETLWEAVSSAIDYAERTGGAFDPTVLPLLRRGPGALPSVGHARVSLDPRARSVRFGVPGMALDLGGIGKGIALDHAAAVLKRKGVSSAFINFGGQVYAMGAPPGERGWTVEVPWFGELIVRDASVSTSGDSERPGHIVSPFTGLTVRRNVSVTVVAPTAAEADAWSTALYVIGPAEISRYHGCAVYAGKDARQTSACRHYIRKKGTKS